MNTNPMSSMQENFLKSDVEIAAELGIQPFATDNHALNMQNNALPDVLVYPDVELLLQYTGLKKMEENY